MMLETVLDPMFLRLIFLLNGLDTNCLLVEVVNFELGFRVTVAYISTS